MYCGELTNASRQCRIAKYCYALYTGSAISFSNSSATLDLCHTQITVKPVTLPPGLAKLARPARHRQDRSPVRAQREWCGSLAAMPAHAPGWRRQYNVRRKSNQFLGVFAIKFGMVRRPAMIDPDTFRPSIHPSSRSPCENAATRAGPTVSSAAKFMRLPMRRTRSDCCALAGNVHAPATAPLQKRDDFHSLPSRVIHMLPYERAERFELSILRQGGEREIAHNRPRGADPTQRPLWVNPGKACREQKFSAAHPIADIHQRSRLVRVVQPARQRGFPGMSEKDPSGYLWSPPPGSFARGCGSHRFTALANTEEGSVGCFVG